MNDTSWNPPAGGWSMEPQPVILPAVDSPAPTPTKDELAEWLRSLPSPREMAREDKQARILARQIARAEHYIKARPLLRNGKAWR